MAEYRLRADAEKWFGHIANKPPLKTKFDLYYFCLMAGIASRRRGGVGEAPGFVDAMPEDYRTAQELIVGMLLHVEIARMGIDLTERNDVRRILAQIVGTSGLSAQGVIRMNEYASGGFEALQESGMAAPYSVPEFLTSYTTYIRMCYA